MYMYTDVYGLPAARIFSAASRSNPSRPTSRVNAPRSAATTRSPSSTATGSAPRPEGDLQRECIGSAAHDDRGGIACLVGTKGIGHSLQIRHVMVPDPGNDVTGEKAGLRRRALGPDAGDADPARRARHVRNRSEIRAVPRR